MPYPFPTSSPYVHTPAQVGGLSVRFGRCGCVALINITCRLSYFGRSIHCQDMISCALVCSPSVTSSCLYCRKEEPASVLRCTAPPRRSVRRIKGINNITSISKSAWQLVNIVAMLVSRRGYGVLHIRAIFSLGS